MQQTKGQTTKYNILREGLVLASINGLVNISIGSLAAKTNMSRSGLFAHFLSKEQLQIEILKYAFDLFDQTIFSPCKELSSPLERIRFLQNELPGWYEKTDPKITGGCIFMMACLEFDDRPGKVKDLLLEQMGQFTQFLKETHQQAVAAGEFMQDSDAEYFSFLFHSTYMGCIQYQKFFSDDQARDHYKKATDQLIEMSQAQTQH